MEFTERIIFELEETLPGKPSYMIKHDQLTPFGIYRQLYKGMILPLKVHPEKPDKVLLDWKN
ncbi:MAG: hypothetical protein JEZ06_05830 [Anaerolineaceae bacterium]|nr:hypothetical protein [Anaerolineaceae bacterium]